MNDYLIREINSDEYEVLKDFLYEAIYVPDGVQPPPRSIICLPELQIYLADFGKEDDVCLVAVNEEKIIGAVWTRIINDYGHVADDVPSLGISVLPEYRNFGVGTSLMRGIFEEVKKHGFTKISLSVQKQNDAVKMYEKLGFEIWQESAEELVMIKTL